MLSTVIVLFSMEDLLSLLIRWHIYVTYMFITSTLLVTIYYYERALLWFFILFVVYFWSNLGMSTYELIYNTISEQVNTTKIYQDASYVLKGAVDMVLNCIWL